MSDLPSFKPMLVPPGKFVATVQSPVKELKSFYDATKFYYQLPLTLESQSSGEEWQYVWSFGPSSELYENFLLAVGGRRHASGTVEPPAEYVGRQFIVRITHRKSAKDASKTVAAVVAVEAFEEDGPKDPEAHKGPVEDCPF